MGDTEDRVSETAKKENRLNPLGEFFTTLVREKKLGAVCGVIVLLFLLVGIFAEYVTPYGYNQLHTKDFLQPPSGQFLLGTDNLGRDLLSRVIFGARISMIVGVVASSLSVVISSMIGLISGYVGGRFDMVAQRFVDAWLCFPGIIVLILAVTVMGPGLWQIVFVLAVQQGIGGARSVRGAVIDIRQNVYLEAAEAIGCPRWRVIIRHILPNVMAPIIVLFTTRMPGLILAEASLSFLGLGIPPPMPSWGGMLSKSGLGYMVIAPWMAIWPGLALTIVVYSINMFGDAVRDILDPRLRGGLGRYGGATKKSRGPKPRSRTGLKGLTV